MLEAALDDELSEAADGEPVETELPRAVPAWKPPSRPEGTWSFVSPFLAASDGQGSRRGRRREVENSGAVRGSEEPGDRGRDELAQRVAPAPARRSPLPAVSCRGAVEARPEGARRSSPGPSGSARCRQLGTNERTSSSRVVCSSHAAPASVVEREPLHGAVDAAAREAPASTCTDRRGAARRTRAPRARARRRSARPPRPRARASAIVPRRVVTRPPSCAQRGSARARAARAARRARTTSGSCA